MERRIRLDLREARPQLARVGVAPLALARLGHVGQRARVGRLAREHVLEHALRQLDVAVAQVDHAERVVARS